jgi:hypothetical protein
MAKKNLLINEETHAQLQAISRVTGQKLPYIVAEAVAILHARRIADTKRMGKK